MEVLKLKIVIVNLEKNPDQTFHIGDRVKLGYDGK